MNILLICTVYPPELARAGLMTKELAEDLGSQEHTVTVLRKYINLFTNVFEE